ncbi:MULTISPECIES: response regulator transcription factor [Leptospira]|uniref:DNA-binding response regulator n=8 Tax=Leptospira TaxID=171 RepID=A0A2N0AHE6_9LEPT|nr:MULTISPECIES: response regulator transcription factor [Leptospira]PKA23143.1 DNA-binding response regulator [Leptospira sp. mixed culture ATI2-C-A1]EKJ87779.1 response regulator receiver domain protein [Leptospira meyeri serovar Hardjo str. Went 5]EMJ89334.1 response regulator receiver domain protein [Leptospira meyeri serovar Semaranga str. Veldrot Semarang 173]EMY71465.1 response regulator receiver domain protein [Leptospira vanthielii serovar Holland str. Waz Holland = ATCC 700522]MBM954
MKKQVYIVDDHPLVVDALQNLIAKSEDLECIGSADNIEKSFNDIEKLQPSLVLIDIQLKQNQNGLQLLKRLRTTFPNIAVIIISMLTDDTFVDRAFKLGAMGYVFKEDTTTQIVEAIHTVLKGDYFVSSSQATRLLGHLYRASQKDEKDPIDRLSNRELEVFLMIGEGMPVKEIAANMGLAPSTIETLRSRIKSKLSITENEKLIRVAVEWKYTQAKTDIVVS